MIATDNEMTSLGASRFWRSRWLAVAAIGIGTAISLAAFGTVRLHSNREMEAAFDRFARNRTARIEASTDGISLTLRSICGFYASSTEVERHEFKTFVGPFLDEFPGIRSIAWAIRVPAAGRAQFESAANSEGLKGFLIRQRSPGGSLVGASARREYFPVHLVEPGHGNEDAAGFDLGSDPALREVLDRACDRGTMVATGLLPPISGQNGPPRVLMAQPIYRNGKPADTPAHRRDNLHGFAVVVLNVTTLIEDSLATLQPAGIDIAVFDDSNSRAEQVLYVHRSRADSDPQRAFLEPLPVNPADLLRTTRVHVGGRCWSIVCSPSPEFFHRYAAWRDWGVLASGMLFTGLMAAYVLGNLTQTTRIGRLVDVRTRRLRESEERYRVIAEHAYDVETWTGPDGRLLWINRAVERLQGYSPEECLAMNDYPHDVIHEDDREAIRQAFRDSLEKKTTANDISARILCKDGTASWVSISWLPITDTEGNYLGLRASFRDISDRKRADASKQLEQSRLMALLQLSQMTSASLSEITDFALEEGVGLTKSTIGYLAFLTHDETVLTMHAWSKTAMKECAIIDKPFVYSLEKTGLWGEAVRQRKPVITNDYAAPNPCKRGYPEGHVQIVRHMNVPVLDGGRIVAVAGVGNKTEDYDESDAQQLTLLMQGMWQLIRRKEADLQLRKAHDGLEARVRDRTIELAIANEGLTRAANELGIAKRAAEAANRAKSDFLANMSHEIRTPMTAIFGYTDLLLDPSLSASSRENYLMVIRRNGEHLLHLINDILDLSKIEAGKLSLEIGTVQPHCAAGRRRQHRTSPRPTTGESPSRSSMPETCRRPF